MKRRSAKRSIKRRAYRYIFAYENKNGGGSGVIRSQRKVSMKVFKDLSTDLHEKTGSKPVVTLFQPI